jgi:hypothetical protein
MAPTLLYESVMRYVVLALVGLCSTARADGFYFSESVGGTRVHDELGAYVGGSATRADIAFGMRRGHWAVQLDIVGDLQSGTTETSSSEAPDVTSVGVSVKYIQPLPAHFEVYVRGRSMHGWGDNRLGGYAGNGLGAGAGIQLKGKLRWVTGALFLDASTDFYRLHDDGAAADVVATYHLPPAIDAQLASFTFGWAFGTDF